MGALQPWHWIVVIAIILLLFGSNRLPGLAKSVGQSMKIFKREVTELRDEGKDDHPTSSGESAPASGGERTSKGDDTPKV